MTDDSMKDWPRKLRRNAESVRLGQYIYYCAAEVYGEVRLWEGLTIQERQKFTAIATDVLDGLRPDRDQWLAEAMTLVKP